MGNEKSKAKKPKNGGKDDSRETPQKQTVSSGEVKEKGPKPSAVDQKGLDSGDGNITRNSKSPDNSSSKDDDSLDPSWDDQVLYSKGNEKKMTADDFEILTVIGKGSFGKVSHDFTFPLMHNYQLGAYGDLMVSRYILSLLLKRFCK